MSLKKCKKKKKKNGMIPISFAACKIIQIVIRGGNA